jgi:hypothetical protein
MKVIRSITKRRGLLSALCAAVECLPTLVPSAADAQGLPVYTGSHLPVALWFAGAAVLGLALVYGIHRNRQRTSSEKQITEQATKDLYAKEDQKERS